MGNSMNADPGLLIAFAVFAGVAAIGLRQLRRAFMKRPVGAELAQTASELLRSGLVIAYRHKEWRGMGRLYGEGTFVYGGTHEGDVLLPSELVKSGWHVEGRREFATSEQFVEWLASMTNADFVAHDRYQPMTRERIAKAVKYSRKSDEALWPKYAG